MPSDLAGLALWFKADAITGLVDGNPVTQWDDSSINARHAVQATGSAQPTYKTGIQNGLPAVRFDGTADYLLTPTFGPLTQPTEVFVVADWNSGEYMVDGSGTQRHAIYRPSGREGMYAGASYVAGANIGTLTPDLWHARFNTNVSPQFRLRGALVLNGGTGAGTQQLGRFTIGAGNAGALAKFGGDIFEIVVVNAALTAAERWQMEQYLSDKWHVNVARRPDTPLTTPTYDGSGQAVHPSVIDFTRQHGMADWNGHRYWMAMTPYPGSNAALENPSILVSSDGTTWSVPAGLTNPIDPAPGGGYNSDPCLTYDPGTNTLYCFYREANGSDYIRVRSSTDGITWSAEVALFTATVDTTLSPWVLFDGTTWRMWTVDYSTSPNTLTLRTSSSPTSGWSAPTVCTSTNPSGRDFWHMSVFEDPRDGTFHGFMTLANLGTAGTGTDVCLMRSTDGLDWTASGVVMDDPLQGTVWDGSQVYLGSGCLKDEDTYAFWYSGANGTTWRIGYAELSTWEAPALP